ncbi:LysR substrate-binding domain-containing protein [Microvirga pakistanensis]|uniref:LysR substrate-binding domain-containing protein n=1 Tax=Microvirga pakistanensis TaxID=1682650 RepID=UPI00195890AF|nr:LysR substrate-binding domain-containing protein [Microvirga pakistanensis]
MTARLPPLNALRCFEKAARLESFAKAADELHLTHSAVSRQIKNLEDELGIPLFERRNRRVYVTEPGRRLLTATTSAFHLIREVCEEIRAKAPAPLVLSCEPTLTQRWLIPRLPKLGECHPDLLVHVVAAGGPVQFDRDRIDLAIRRDDFAWDADTYSIPIVDEWVGPVVSPALLQTCLDGRSPLSLPLIHSATRLDAWERWCRENGKSAGSRESRTFEHFYLSIQAAVAGLGIAIGPYPLVIDEIRAGRLVAPFGFTPNGHQYVLLTKKDLVQEPRATMLLEWLKAEAADLSPSPRDLARITHG